MSDEGDRACPLCAEEMDLTDQQLKPCKCGYEICVWCWHQIMDMAEKDQTQGRCPACRTPYNKEKVVSTAANCERLVAEMNMEKKMKSQKTKSKISDTRKQLGSVRVILKSLVYIAGLPLSLADENLLQNKDYFGQYGRVLKVSISRTAAGSIQQFANSTCNVYITYSKEEEAVRCIQSVHGFVLDDRPLRACFGTTKYCHAWLRNAPCINPDCLYLHEVGIQEDTFTKDETISEYTRNRVQQITGATSNMQLRSGNVLPPPADEGHISSFTLTGKPTSRSYSNNVATSVNGCPPNSIPGRSVALPPAASWGARACKGNSPSSNIACSNGPSKPKSETCSGLAAFSTAAAATVQVPRLHAETREKLINNEESQNKQHKGGQEPVKSSSKQYTCTDSNTSHEAPGLINSLASPKDNRRCISIAPIETTSMKLAGRSSYRGPENDLNVSAGGNNDSLCSRMDSVNITNLHVANHSGENWPNCSVPSSIANSSVNLEKFRESSILISLGKTVSPTDDSRVPKEQSGLRTEFHGRRRFELESDLKTVGAIIDSQVASPRARDHLQSLEGNKLKDSEFVASTSYFSAPSLSLHHSTLSDVHFPKTRPYVSSSLFQELPILNNNVDNGVLPHPGNSAVLNGYHGNVVNNYLDSDKSFEHANSKNKLVGKSEYEAPNAEQSFSEDMGESNMISNILSLEFDPWEESLASPQNLIKLLAEGDKRQGTLAPSSSGKAQNSNKSRFSFARPDEYSDLLTNVEPSFSHMQQVFKESPLSRDFSVNRELHFDEFGDCNGFSSFNTEEPANLAGSYSYLSSNKFSGSRFQVSAPPGFSTPIKAPPPGFSSHERMGPNFDAISGNHFLDASSLRNPYQSPQNGNIGSNTDIEFMDPAILAVGKGKLPMGMSNGVSLDMNSNYSPQVNVVENEVIFQSLMQRLSPPVQNLRFSGMGNSFGPMNDPHNHIHSRIMEQTPASNLSPFLQHNLQHLRTSMVSNGQWNGWTERKNASEMGMAELLRTENLGLNNFYGGYEDSKFCMPSSGDIYNRTYGI